MINYDLLKRLEIIKSAVAIADHDLIDGQVLKIIDVEYDADISAILWLLSQHEFAKAIQAIDDYLANTMALTRYDDNELNALKLELKRLEQRLQQLTEQKNDAELDIDDFHRDYTLKLGAVIQKLLNLKTALFQQQLLAKQTEFQTRKQEYEAAKQHVFTTQKKAEQLKQALSDLDDLSDEYQELYQDYAAILAQLLQQERDLKAKRDAAKAAKDDLADDPVQADYQEAIEDSATFEQEYETLRAEVHFELSAEQSQQLKTAYRKASRLCHPDIVPEALKEQAHSIMSELNRAKKAQDLPRILEILNALLSGSSFGMAPDLGSDKQLLKLKIAEIKQKIAALETEWAEIQASETYQLIQEIGDRDGYFAQLKAELEQECQALEQEVLDM